MGNEQNSCGETATERLAEFELNVKLKQDVCDNDVWCMFTTWIAFFHFKYTIKVNIYGYNFWLIDTTVIFVHLTWSLKKSCVHSRVFLSPTEITHFPHKTNAVQQCRFWRFCCCSTSSFCSKQFSFHNSTALVSVTSLSLTDQNQGGVGLAAKVEGIVIWLVITRVCIFCFIAAANVRTGFPLPFSRAVEGLKCNSNVNISVVNISD